VLCNEDPIDEIDMPVLERPEQKKRSWYHTIQKAATAITTTRVNLASNQQSRSHHSLTPTARLATKHLIKKRQRARRVEPSIIRLRNRDLHSRNISRSIHRRTSVVVAVALDHTEQLGAVVTIELSSQRIPLREEGVFVRVQVFAGFDVLPHGCVVLQGGAGAVRLDLL
jgi:hypothetical protein